MAVVAFVAVSLVRAPFADWEATWVSLGLSPFVMGLGVAVSWVFWLWLLGAYRFRIGLTAKGDAPPVFYAACLQLVFAFAAFFLLDMPQISRVFLFTLSGLLVMFTLGSRALVRTAFRTFRIRGYGIRYALIVGTGRSAQDWADLLESQPDVGIRVVGHLFDGDEPLPLVSRPILGSLTDLEDLIRKNVVDEVGVALPPTVWPMLRAIVGVALETGAVVRIPIWDGELRISIPGGRMDEIAGVQVMSIVRGPERFASLILKRGLDTVAAAVGLVLLSPLFLAVALYIRAKDGSPVFFRQVRVGVNGRTFRMVKFRTMVKDAEARLEEVRSLNKISGPALQIDRDPRIMPWGALLRKTSIDELPQLWNVLVGDMSLVGPRPAPIVEVEGYDLWHRRRLTMRPGITGLAQVAIRRFEDFDVRAELDLKYIDTWSLALDTKLILQTVPAVLGGGGR